MHAVILAGGGGTRLWPLSRRARPKPFLPLVGETQPLPADAAAHRAAHRRRGHARRCRAGASAIGLATRRRSSSRGISSVSHLAATPRPRSRSRRLCRSARASDVMVVLPADHFIDDEQGFRDVLSEAARAAQDGSLVTLGIQASGPETGYGYIVGREGGGRLGGEARRSVRREAAARAGYCSCSPIPAARGGTPASSCGARTRSSKTSSVTHRQ